jgi:uncharacterized membrane protein YfcA
MCTKQDNGPIPQGGLGMATATSSAGIAKTTSHKMLWIAAAGLAVMLAAVLYALPDEPNFFLGFSSRHFAAIELILYLSGVMSGLAGFGFSGIGAACLLFMEPILVIPALQALGGANQIFSVGQLRADMPRTLKDLLRIPGPPILGGSMGIPIGIWLLSHLPAKRLMVVFGTLLVVYSLYSMFKPTGTKVRGLDGPYVGFLAGFLGGIVGGFTAFPGAMVVVWTGLRDLPKELSRAIVQPYLIMTQIYSVGLIAWLHPSYLSHRYWILLLVTLPVVLPGTYTGVMIYRRISDVNFKRICYFLLGLSGTSLLLKIHGADLLKLLF